MSRKTLASQVIADVVRVARQIGHTPSKNEYLAGVGAFSEDTIDLAFGSWETGLRAAGLVPRGDSAPIEIDDREPKILLFDLETAPMRVFTFGLFDQNIGLNQIDQDWFLLSFAAKWLGKPAIYYADQSKADEITDDSRLLKMLWHLLDEADVVITQNGRSFDEKVANARFVLKGMPPPSPFKHIDTKVLAKKRFRFTSNKLEYLSNALGVECKKSSHKKFPGFELWRECLRKNQEAWQEMASYNKADVLALEGVYEKLKAWGVGVDLNAFYGDIVYRCQCGGSDFKKNGWDFTKSGKFRRFVCKSCGAWHSAKGKENNFMSGAKKASLKTPKGE